MGKGGGGSYHAPDVPAASAPVTSSNDDVVKVKAEQKERARRAAGWQSTLLSGLGGGNSKLGGGQ